MLFNENLEEIVFHRHEMFDVDELIIISGYVGPQPISRLKELPFKTTVIYGMYGSDGIGEKLHYTLQKLEDSLTNVKILYSNMPVHSKCYIWRKDLKIVTALVGSANFSVSGLSNPYKEVLAETTYDTFVPLNAYFDRILNYTVKCMDSSVKTKKRKAMIEVESHEISENSSVCRASFLNHKGKVPEKSGLNWGNSSAHTKLGDAYIALRKQYICEYPLMFPPKQIQPLKYTDGAKQTRQNDAVEFIWDDGTIMEGLLEGTQEVKGVLYPKQICSSPKKNILGCYLRHRLGVPLDHIITYEDLEKYGKSYVEISLQSEGVYYLDFSDKKGVI